MFPAFEFKDLIPTILFMLLIPGVLLTIPGAEKSIDLGTSKAFAKTMVPVFVHGLVFHLLNCCLTQYLAEYN